MGQTSFVLEDLVIDLDEGVGIGFSQLHHLRANALESLRAQALGRYRQRVKATERDGLPLREEPPSPGVASRAAEPCKVAAWATNPACARAAKRAGADAIYVPLVHFKRGQSHLQGARLDQAEQAGYPKQCIMALPTIDHDPIGPKVLPSSLEIPPTREWESSFDVWDYVREGKPVFADSLGAVIRALDAGALVEVGPHVPVTNRASLGVMADWGVSRVWLSPELTLGQIADLADYSRVPLGVVISGSQELMITEHCLLMSQGECAQQCESCPRRTAPHALIDRKGFEFPVCTDLFGRSHLYNGIELDIVSSLPDLMSCNISSVMVDTTLMGKKSASDAVGRALRARALAMSEGRSVGKRPNTTTGHLFRGVS